MSQQLSVSASHPHTTTDSAFTPTLIPVVEVARLLGISTRSVWRLDSGGLIPRSVTLGSSKRWRRDELLSWINADCPPRAKWQWEQLHQSA